MTPKNDQELEVKFYLSDPNRFKNRLEFAGGQVIQPRVHEINLRFDTPDQSLARSSQVLRLRKDTVTTLTYKGSGEIIGGVRVRREIEFTLSDFSAARDLLEALGFQVSLLYEKYRTTYAFDEVQITLDEMPYGHFTEIEGPDAASIHSASQKLGLDWEARIVESYTRLFERLRSLMDLTFRDLTFENFSGLVVTPEMLNVHPADGDQPM